MTKRVAVALSGGVDSSVAALLLKEQGYDIIGVSAKTSNSKEAETVIQNAEQVAKKLDIPFCPYDAAEIFQEKVINYFEKAYASGTTPNPCIMCNKYMKWGALFDFAADNLGVDFIATGHYARIKEDRGSYKLYPAEDEHKDQLYFLFMLDQKRLARTLFPLSGLKKEDIRKIAIDNDLPSKSSKESQDICFIKPPLTTKKYLNNIFTPKEGVFIEKTTGKILGKHDGFWQYTIGQRKGIGLAAPEALYVVDIDACNNIVYVGYKESLFVDNLELDNFNWSYPNEFQKFDALAKIRYNMQAVPCSVIVKEQNNLLIKFSKKVSAIAKGQACVLYAKDDGHLLGGGFI